VAERANENEVDEISVRSTFITHRGRFAHLCSPVLLTNTKAPCPSAACMVLSLLPGRLAFAHSVLGQELERARRTSGQTRRIRPLRRDQVNGAWPREKRYDAQYSNETRNRSRACAMSDVACESTTDARESGLRMAIFPLSFKIGHFASTPG